MRLVQDHGCVPIIAKYELSTSSLTRITAAYLDAQPRLGWKTVASRFCESSPHRSSGGLTSLIGAVAAAMSPSKKKGKSIQQAMQEALLH